MRIKICGITRVEDACAAVEAGADAIGLVFARSPRRVDVRTARRIIAGLPPFVMPVGVFAGAKAAEVRRTANSAGLSVVQLHGDEGPEMIAELAPLRVIRAVRVRDRRFADEVRALCASESRGRPAALLLDAYSPAARGGTGRRFDWDLVVGAREAGAFEGAPPIVLAGGLTPANVARAIRVVRPDAVDVSGGVETSPGVKDREKMERFVDAVRNAVRGTQRRANGTRSKPR